jgi:hypothetical protein
MLGNRSPKEEVSMAKHWVRSQPDLFEKKPRPAMALAPAEREGVAAAPSAADGGDDDLGEPVGGER